MRVRLTLVCATTLFICAALLPGGGCGTRSPGAEATPTPTAVPWIPTIPDVWRPDQPSEELRYAIGGQVTEEGAAGLGGVWVDILHNGLAVAGDMTSPGGMYTVDGLVAGEYVVRPSRDGYTLTPPQPSITLSEVDASVIDFIARPATQPQTAFSISGTVRDSSGGPLPGVQVGARPTVLTLQEGV